MPMIVDMLGALATTKFPLLWGSAALYPGEHGFWDFVHESRVECAMLCDSLFLLAVGSGRRSLDARCLAGVQEGRCPPLTRRHSRHFEVFMRGSDGYGSLGE